MPKPSPSKRLYIRNLPKYVNHKALAKSLSSYGKITEVKIVQDYAFVQFDSLTDAQDVVDTFRTQQFLGHDIVVEFARPLRKDALSTTSSNSADTITSIPLKPKCAPADVQCRYPVVVSNLPRKVRWQELKDFGRSTGAMVAYCDLDKTQRGRGFIEYFSQGDADLAILRLDNALLGGQRVRVSARPETFERQRARSRSRSPKPREFSLPWPYGYDDRRYIYHRRSDAYDYYHRGSPPPAYYALSGPPAHSPRWDYDHPRWTPRHHSPPHFADEAGMASSHVYSDAWYRSEPTRYKEQYDYASQGSNLNAWNTDYTYDGAVARINAEGASSNNQFNYAYDAVLIKQETFERLLPGRPEQPNNLQTEHNPA